MNVFHNRFTGRGTCWLFCFRVVGRAKNIGVGVTGDVLGNLNILSRTSTYVLFHALYIIPLGRLPAINYTLESN